MTISTTTPTKMAVIAITTTLPPPTTPPTRGMDTPTVAISISVVVSAMVDDNSVLVTEVVVTPGSTIDVAVVAVVAVLSVGASVVTGTGVVGSVSVKGSSGVTVVSCSVSIYNHHTVNL